MSSVSMASSTSTCPLLAPWRPLTDRKPHVLAQHFSPQARGAAEGSRRAGFGALCPPELYDLQFRWLNEATRFVRILIDEATHDKRAAVMRKVCLTSLGAIAGAAVTLVTSESRTVIEGSSAKAAAAGRSSN